MTALRTTASALAAFATLSLGSAAARAQGYNQPAEPPPDMQAGGLAPPPPVDQSGSYYSQNSSYSSTPTEQQLQRADREDSGRGLEFFWLNGEIGIEHLGLQTFEADNLVPEVVDRTPVGPVYGGGLGIRLVFLTLGARFRLADFPEWQLWTLNGELGFRIPLGRLEPHFTFGGGYASLGSFSSDNIGANLNSEDVDITGYNVRGGFGLDFYLSPVFSLGANLTGELLVLTRPGVDPSKLGMTTGDPAADVYRADGSSVGSAVTLTAVAGLHF